MVLTALALLIANIDSGLKLGEFMPAYEPTHVSGPDKGTQTCPVCKYGTLPAVQVWVNGDDEANVRTILTDLETRVGNSKHKLKAFVVLMTGNDEAATKAKWQGQSQKVGIVVIGKDSEAAKNYEVNLAAKNTVFVYRDLKLKSKFVDLRADKAGLKALNTAITKVDL